MPRESKEPSGEILHIDELARKYGFDSPDEWVGPPSSQYIPDWGPPVVLADSAVTSEMERLNYPEIRRNRRTFLERLSERLFGKSEARLQAEAIIAERDAAWNSILKIDEEQ